MMLFAKPDVITAPGTSQTRKWTSFETQATLAEKRRGFIDDARAAAKEVEENGVVYRAEDVHRYIRARAAGKKVVRSCVFMANAPDVVV